MSSVQSAPLATGIAIGEGAKAKGSYHCKPILVFKKNELNSLCDPNYAIQMYPQSADRVKETGIPTDLKVQ